MHSNSQTKSDLGLNIKNSGYTDGQIIVINEPICIAGIHFNLNNNGIGSMRILTQQDIGTVDFGPAIQFQLLDVISKFAKVDQITFDKISNNEMVQILFSGNNKPQIWLAGIEMKCRLASLEIGEYDGSQYYPLILDSIDYSSILIIDV